MADIVANRDTNNDGSLGADDRPKRDGQGWRQGRGMMRHGMMGHGMMGGGNCGDGGGDAPDQPPGAPDDAPDGAPDEPANP
jgi:hypothetical protein